MPRARATGRRAGGKPLSATLDVLAPFLPRALVSPGAIAAVAHAARHLPAQLSDELYLECRLAPGAARVDLVLHVRGEGRGVLAGSHRGAALAPALERRGAWRRLRSFCGAWEAPSTDLHGALDGLWLELDVTGPASALAPPGVFLDLRRLAARGASPGECCARAGEWLGLLAGRPLTPGVHRALGRCLEALPPGAGAAYAGLFAGRGNLVRCCVRGVRPAALPAYLARVGWQGDAASLTALVGGLAELAPVAMVHLDLDGGGVRGRIGVELALERRSQLSGTPVAGVLRKRLVALGLAAPGKAAALAGWPGWTEEVMPHQPWPSVLARRVNHLKLVFEPGRSPEAKAYLWARHTHRRAAPEREDVMKEHTAGIERVQPARLFPDADELDDDALEQAAGGLARAWIGDEGLMVGAPAPPPAP